MMLYCMYVCVHVDATDLVSQTFRRASTPANSTNCIVPSISMPSSASKASISSLIGSIPSARKTGSNP